MKKKIISMLLVAAMAISMVACGGSDAGSNEAAGNNNSDAGNAGANQEASGEYKLDQIVCVVNGTLTATTDSGQQEFEKQWEDAVGVDLVIKQLDHSSYNEQVGTLFVSGDYPDVMIMSADMYAQYAPTGILWDMTAAYENAEFQSRVTSPVTNEALKKDGKLYGFAPAYGNGCVSYVKTAWLEKIGMTAEDIKTYDDYIEMLTRFTTMDPDGNGKADTYGVIAAGFLGNEAPYINYLPEFWQDAYPAILKGEDGVWYDGFNTQATKNALLRLQKAYEAGLIDPTTLTNGTKDAREKWFSNDQSGSSGVFTYWAGSWYQTLTDNLSKNEVDDRITQIAPIKEVGAYLDREAPVWVIIDDGDGNNDREQAIFDAFIETMLDGDTVQTLWVYGAEDVHWSTKAEEFVLNAGTEKEKPYKYEDGQFHLKQNPNDPNSLWKKNAIDPALLIAPLTNGFIDISDLANEGNTFFLANCKAAPESPASETYTENSGTIYDAKIAVVTEVVTKGGDVDAAMQKLYVDVVGATVEQCLAELNAQ